MRLAYALNKWLTPLNFKIYQISCLSFYWEAIWIESTLTWHTPRTYKVWYLLVIYSFLKITEDLRGYSVLFTFSGFPLFCAISKSQSPKLKEYITAKQN